MRFEGKHAVRRAVLYALFRCLQGLFKGLPWSVAQKAGCWVGRLCYTTLGTYRRLAIDNLKQALRQDDKAAQAVARRVFEQLGMNLFEWLKLPALSARQLQERVHVEGLEYLQAALQQGRGVILLSGHFGNWEVMPLYLASLGFEGSVLARRFRYPEYEQYFMRLRQQWGVNTLQRGGSLRGMLKELQANHVVGIMPDQDIDSVEGIFVDFFDRPAYTPVGPALLAVLSQAPVVPLFNIRRGSGFRLVIQQALPLPEQQDREAAVAAFTQAWSRVIERMIRTYPDHWVWMHRRWKTQEVSGGSPNSR